MNTRLRHRDFLQSFSADLQQARRILRRRALHMALSAGTRLGPYEILGLIGPGDGGDPQSLLREPTVTRVRSTEVINRLAALYDGWGKLDKAVEWRHKLPHFVGQK